MTLAARISKLEERGVSPARYIVVSAFAAGPQSEGVVESFLAAEGIVPANDDIVVCLSYQTPLENGAPLKLVSVTGMRG